MSRSAGSSLKVLSLLVRLAVGSAVLLAAAGIVAYLVSTRPEPGRAEHAIKPLVVRAITVSPVAVPRVWEGHGTARAKGAAEVSAEVSARVVERPERIDPGVPVEAGEVLLRLDPTDFEQRAIALEQTIASWEAQLGAIDIERESLTERVSLIADQVGVLEREYQRAVEATGLGAGTATEVEVRLGALRRTQGEASALGQQLATLPARRAQLEAGIQMERANLRIAQENVRRATITAPIAGVLQSIGADVGELPAVGAPVARVVDLSLLEIPLRLPVSARAMVGVGDRVELRTESARPAEWEGRIARISPEADAGTRTITVYVEVAQELRVDADAGRVEAAGGAPRLLMPGEFVIGRVTGGGGGGGGEERLMVPRRAVDGDSVMIVEGTAGEGPRRARRANVRILHQIDARFPALDPLETQWSVLESGLSPGDRVIVTNLDQIRDGTRVMLEGEALPPRSDEPGGGSADR